MIINKDVYDFSLPLPLVKELTEIVEINCSMALVERDDPKFALTLRDEAEEAAAETAVKLDPSFLCTDNGFLDPKRVSTYKHNYITVLKGLSGQGADLRIEAQLLDGLYSGLLQGLEPSAPPDLDHDQPCLEVGNFCLSSSNDECMGGADSALLDGLDRDLAGQRVLGLAPAALLFCHALASPSHACFPLCMAALSLRAALQRGGMPFIRMACLEGALLEVRSGLGELSLRTVPDADLARSATALLISVLHGLALTLSRRLESGQVSAGPAQDGLPAQILALLRERGRISAGELMGELSAPRSTVRYHMAALARQGLVMGHGVGRGAFYTLRHGALGAD